MDALLQKRISISFDGKASGPSLSELCRNLLKEQKASWADLSLGYEALKSVRVKELRCNGFSVRLHHNPRRIKSTTAPVDQESIDKRPCFLCLENLPQPQRGILYKEDFIILCNPFPICPEHYTIAHIIHGPQSFEGMVSTFLKMAKDFSPDFNVFYNGPESGASAPDHLHFQAIAREILPIEREIGDRARLAFLKCIQATLIFRAKNVGREAIIMEGQDCIAICQALVSIVSATKSVLSSPAEPRMNLLCSYNRNKWRVVIFPRQKHRPSVYFLPGNERILISPGLVEMGGIVVTPIEKDFDIVNEELIRKIYTEVSVNKETIQKILAALSF
jgi:ATP adenylyltransferase/5',5'''-P-1,P-4-tetraphosphate phosphorylase II